MAVLTAVAAAGTLAKIGAVASIATGVIGAIGSIQSANAQAAAAEYNAQVQERNAVIAEQNRKLAVQTSEIEAEDKRRENRRVLASMRAAYGATGLELAGSPLDVLEDTALEQELDVQRIRFEGRARSREGAIQILGLKENASLSRFEGQNAKRAGKIQAIGQVVGGIGRGIGSLT